MRKTAVTILVALNLFAAMTNITAAVLGTIRPLAMVNAVCAVISLVVALSTIDAEARRLNGCKRKE